MNYDLTLWDIHGIKAVTNLTLIGDCVEAVVRVKDTKPEGISSPVIVSVTVPWLTVAPNSGNTALNVTVTASSLGLGAGTYQGFVVFTSHGLANSPLKLPVKFFVLHANHKVHSFSILRVK